MTLKTKLVGVTLALTASIVVYFEGTVMKTYRDPIGILTDCTGHTGPDVKAGYVNTPAECKAKLEADLQEAHDTIVKCYPVAKMRPGEVAALTSLAFNVGPGGKGVKDGVCTLKNGNVPTIRRKFIAGDNTGACHEIPKWANPPLRGIIKRRAAEEAMCLSVPGSY